MSDDGTGFQTSETGTGASTTFVHPGPASDVQLMDAITPDDYKEKPWAKNLQGKPVSEIFKKVDSLESLLGQRNVRPADDAPAENWTQYRKQMGVPDAPASYKYEPPKPADSTDNEVWEQVSKARDVEWLKEVSHKLDISDKQFQGLLEAAETRSVRLFKEQQAQGQTSQAEQQAQVAKEFQELAQTAFGDQKERVLDQTKNILIQTVPASVKPFIAKLDVNSLIVLAAYVHGAHREDGPPNLNGATGQSVQTEAALNSALVQVMTESKALLDKGSNSPRLKELTDKKNTILDQLDAMRTRK